MLNIQLLGTPGVTLDGRAVTFPFKRADALLYYMAVRRSATRQELISLLWESCDESLGLKNLRNALYTIKKCLGGDFFLSPQKATVSINPQWELDCDYDRFLAGDAAAYGGPFLQGFAVKNAFAYEEWLGHTREKLLARYLGGLAARARAALESGETARAGELAQTFLEEDPFHEEMTALLMRCHRQSRRYAQAAQAYQTLKEKLARELGTDPQEETTRLYYQIMNEWNSATKPPAEAAPLVPVGREEAYTALAAGLEAFAAGFPRCSRLIVGEGGSGKRDLLHYFLSQADTSPFLVLRAACLLSEEQLPLACWEILMPALGEFVGREQISLPVHVQAGLGQAFLQKVPARYLGSADALPDHLLTLMDAVTRRKKVLLILEDIQWIDGESLALVDRLLRRVEGEGLMAVLTCREECGPGVQAFRSRAAADGLLQLLRLHPLTREQTQELLLRELGEEAAGQLAGRFYEETRGNLHLLTQLTQAYRRSGDVEDIMRSMEDILMERLVGLREESARVAELIAVLEDEAPYALLLELMDRDDRQLASALQELLERRLIEEPAMDSGGFRFVHRRIRTLVYNKLTSFARRPLHLRVARLLTEKEQPRDAKACRRVAEHFSRAEDALQAARYRIRALELESVQSCEPFGPPAFPGAPPKPAAALEEEAARELGELARLRRDQGESEALTGLERMLLRIRGRIALFEGRISDGTALLGGLSGGRGDERDVDLMVHACALLAGSAIYAQATELAERYTLTGMRLLGSSGDSLLFPLFQRLRGNCFCLRGEYDKSIYYLQEALDALEKLPDSTAGALQLAGTYYDYGRVCRHRGDYARSASFFKQALALLEGQRVTGAVWVYVNYGRLAFSLEDNLRAREYFRKGYAAGEQTGELWGMGVASAYMAYYHMLDGAYAESARLLEQARHTAIKLGSPLEEAILCFVSMLMKDHLDKEGRAQELFRPLLPYSVESYARQGTRKLSGVPDVFEVSFLSRRLREGIAAKNRYTASELYSKNKHFMAE